MFKISLVNMPFSTLNLPSIALTQLAAVTERELGERVRVRVLYLNHDFAHYLGDELYAAMNSSQSANSGLGDWFFRHLAFPREADNAQQYFQRYFPHRSAETDSFKGKVLAKRAGVRRFMDRLIAKHRLGDEDLVGFTSMFSQNVASFAMGGILKEGNPRLVTVLGGANCETPMGRELARHVEQLDFVCSGPGLVAFPKLVGHLVDGEEESCHEIPGLFSKRNLDSELLKGHGAIGAELPIEVPVPLDYEPFLDTLERSFPNGSVPPYLTFETSRGCWWGERSHCTFCGLNGGTMAYRAMSPPAALELFQKLVDQYGDRCSRFDSVDNILPREYLQEVFPNFQPPDTVSFFYEVKADLKEHEMEILSKSRVTEIQPGIESLATSTLKLMRKGTTAFQNIRFLKSCVKFAINPAWNLLIGFPGEAEEVYEKYMQDIPLLVHLPPPSGAFPVRFDRYSPYFVRADEYGLELSPYDFYRFSYPLDDEALKNIAYYFEDQNYSAAYLQDMVAWKDKLNGAIREWTTRWRSQEAAERPELRLIGYDGARVVLDSRSGTEEEHPVDSLDLAILEQLRANGYDCRRVAKLCEADEAEVTERIERFAARGWVFGENDRYISLVLDEPEPAMTAFDMTQTEGREAWAT